MPWRSTSELGKYWARKCSKVGPVSPLPSCTTSPAGLLITRRLSSSKIILAERSFIFYFLIDENDDTRNYCNICQVKISTRQDGKVVPDFPIIHYSFQKI